MNSLIKNKLKQVLGNQVLTKFISNSSPHTVVVVLMYHDICDDDDFISWLRVKKSSFEFQIRKLLELGHFIRPSDLFQIDALRKHTLNFLMTFDDGFVNNYKLALPILKKFQIPALFFISTEHIQSGEQFWFDRVITPIQIHKITSLDLQHLGLRDYRFFPSEGPIRWNDIQALLLDIKAKGNATDPDVRRILGFFDEISRDISADVNNKYRPLTHDEICQMQTSKLCYFGSHSHRHEILTYLTTKDLIMNLVKSKEFLEKLLGQPITHFAYPNGDTNTSVTMYCRKSGYEYCYLATSGLVNSHTNTMYIPRIPVSGYDSIQSLFWKINKELIKAAIKLR